MHEINLDRGVTQKNLPDGGPLISMYKDQPGDYFDETGIEVKESVAKQAGFDVKANRIEKARRILYAQKKAEVDKQLDEAEARSLEEAKELEEKSGETDPEEKTEDGEDGG